MLLSVFTVYFVSCILVEVFQASPEYLMSIPPIDPESFALVAVPCESCSFHVDYYIIDRPEYLVYRFYSAQSTHFSVLNVCDRVVSRGFTFSEAFSSFNFFLGTFSS